MPPVLLLPIAVLPPAGIPVVPGPPATPVPPVPLVPLVPLLVPPESRPADVDCPLFPPEALLLPPESDFESALVITVDEQPSPRTDIAAMRATLRVLVRILEITSMALLTELGVCVVKMNLAMPKLQVALLQGGENRSQRIRQNANHAHAQLASLCHYNSVVCNYS